MSLYQKRITNYFGGNQQQAGSSTGGNDRGNSLHAQASTKPSEIDSPQLTYRRPQRQAASQSNTVQSEESQQSTGSGAASDPKSSLTRSVYEHDEIFQENSNSSYPDSRVSPVASVEFQNNETNRQRATEMNPNRNEACSSKPRRVYVMRHGERCDFALGKNWLEYLSTAFSDSTRRHTIRRPNLNIPAHLPNRSAYELAKDSPLTEIGLFQAYKTGMAFAEAGVRISRVYSSPALRCIQTAFEVLRGMRSFGASANEPVIRIEAGLFEWCGWYKSGMPKFMTYDELMAFNPNYPIDPSYRSFYDSRKYDVLESTEDYFKRAADTTDSVLAHATAGREDQEVLLVGHTGSLYTCTRRLIGRGDVRGHSAVKHFKELAAKVPYCGLCVAEEQLVPGSTVSRTNKWRIVQPPCPTFVHSSNAPFDWRLLV